MTSVWQVRVDIDSLLSSISAVVSDRKIIHTPDRLFWGFRADQISTTYCSGCRVQVWVQDQAPAGHLAITAKGQSRRQSKVLTAKSMAKLLGPSSSNAWAGWTGNSGKHKHREFPSLRQLLLAATSSLEEKLLPLLLYWLSSRVKKVLMICKFLALWVIFFFMWNEIFNRIGKKLLPTNHQILQVVYKFFRKLI